MMIHDTYHPGKLEYARHTQCTARSYHHMLQYLVTVDTGVMSLDLCRTALYLLRALLRETGFVVV